MKSKHLFLLAGLGILTLCFPAVQAVKNTKQFEPQWMGEVTKAVPGKFQDVPPCELSYNLSWNGLIKAGEAKLKLGLRDPEKPNHLLGICEGESAGFAKRLWFYKNLFRSQVDSESLRPIYFEATETEKKEKVTTKAIFRDGVVTSTERVEERSSGSAETKERTFAYEHAHDLLSSVLYLRSHPLNDGDQINLVIHPFKSAYFAKFRVLGRETFESAMGKQKAIKLDIKLFKIDRDDLELKSYDKFKEATIWISEDVYRMPLEIRSKVFIGSVRATLAERHFLEKP